MPLTEHRSLSGLRNLRRQRDFRERCDLCGAPVGPGHAHLIEPAARKLMCACQACSLLFPANGPTKYKRVPRRIRFLSQFRMTNAAWDSLLIPIGMAFFVESSVEKRVLAFYPSPAGATESMLPLDAWNDIVRENPSIGGMEQDVEALLVNRIGAELGADGEYFLAPIDICYELVGLIRTRWRGLSGGAEMWQEIRQFFDELRRRAATETSHA